MSSKTSPAKPPQRKSDPSPAPSSPSTTKRNASTSTLSGAGLGYFFIALVCVIWIAASFLVARLEAHGVSPVMLSFICSSGFVTLVPFRARMIARHVIERVGRGGANGTRDGRGTRRGSREEEEIAAGKGTAANEGKVSKRHAIERERGMEIEMASLVENGEAKSGKSDAREQEARSRTAEPYSFERHLEAAITVAPLWVLAQVAFDYSLLMTTVTANSMLSSSSAVFTFMVSVYCGLDKFSWTKAAAVGAYVVGSVLVTLADDDKAASGAEFNAEIATKHPLFMTRDFFNSPAFGNILALAAAGLYASYTATMKLHLREDERTDMTLFFSLMGLVNFFGYGAVLVIGRALGGFTHLYHAFDARAFWLACTKAFFDNVLSDYLWARAVLLTSPTIASIGLSLQIPLAASVEVVIGHPIWASKLKNALIMTGGTVFILLGFAGVTAN